jgi:hypothetical protein
LEQRALIYHIFLDIAIVKAASFLDIEERIILKVLFPYLRKIVVLMKTVIEQLVELRVLRALCKEDIIVILTG